MPAAKKDKETDSTDENESSFSALVEGDRNRACLPILLLPVIRNCPKCEHVVKNGSIHSTLAYSRCRCHRQWKYYMPAEETELQSKERMINASTGSGSAQKPFPLKSQNLLNKTGPQTHGAGPPGMIKRYCMTRKPSHLPPLATPPSENKTIYSSSSSEKASQSRGDHMTLHPLMNTHKSFNKTSSQEGSPLQGSINHILKDPTGINCNHGGTISEALSIDSNRKTTQKLLIHTMKSNTQSPVSSIPTLPQIQSSSLLHQSMADAAATDDTTATNSSANEPKVKKCTPSKFEFISLLKFVPDQQKLNGAELFDSLDQNDDGHLTFLEVYTGLTKNWQSSLAKAKFELYLKPLYHALGDETYFGKRDFILCYNLAQIFEEHSYIILHLSVSTGTQFYSNIMKPLMSTLVADNDNSDSVLISRIEEAVQKFDIKHNKIRFNPTIAQNFSGNNEDISLLKLLIFAPHFFSIHK